MLSMRGGLVIAEEETEDLCQWSSYRNMATKVIKPKALQALDWKTPKPDNHTRFVCISGK